MIFKRAVARLGAQDWLAIAIELAIVIIGVFIGIWVANWNQERSERNETRQTLLQLEPELDQLEAFSSSARHYYASAGHYAEVAFAGWRRDPKVSDADFVIAAYQASQILGFNNNGASWALVFGASDLRKIPDPQIRQTLTRLMTFDYSTINTRAMETRYRDHVREMIPDSIQQDIRKNCGDIIKRDGVTVVLPATCPIAIEPVLATRTAERLRADPSLERELSQHRSTVDVYLTRLELFDLLDRRLAERIKLLDR